MIEDDWNLTEEEEDLMIAALQYQEDMQNVMDCRCGAYRWDEKKQESYLTADCIC